MAGDSAGAEGGVAVILLAAGASRRMGDGPDSDKLWAALDGEPLIAHPLRVLAALPGVDVLVVVAPAERHEALRTLAAAEGREPACELRLTEGGERRRDSVAAGMAAAPDAIRYLVHDGARPLVSATLAGRVLEAARECGAAIPAVPVADTLKLVDADGRVAETVDRDPLRAAQTPQAFDGPLLRRAHSASTADATDDAALVEQLGEQVGIVPGDPANMKVATTADLEVARALMAARRVVAREGGA